MFTRLMRQPPEKMNTEFRKVTVVEDDLEAHPTFASLLMGDVDKDLVQCYSMFFYLFERATGNSLVALFLVWTIEYCLYNLRDTLSQRNLSKKAYVDEVFLK